MVRLRCTRLLKVPLGSNINFIVGPNGSGKSAVLTAIMIGLGGKIGATSRGTKASNLIKNGESQGIVRIEVSGYATPK